MSKRSAIATLVRVAELQEAVARGAAGRALARSREAHDEIERARNELANAGLAGGTREALETTTQVRLWRAEGLQVAEQQAHEVDQERTVALEAWTHARRRHRLFDGLAERKRDEARRDVEKAEQRLADELAGLRGDGS